MIKNINQLYPLQLGNFAIMHHPKIKHMYIGEILNISTKGSGICYGSVLTTDGTSGLSALLLQYIA